MTANTQTAEQPKTLEQMIEGGEVAHALLLKGGWSERDVNMILNAYQVGIDAGLALCAKRSHEPPRTPSTDLPQDEPESAAPRSTPR